MKTEKAYRPFSLLALTVPAAEAAVGKNWLPTLMLALAAILIHTWVSIQKPPQWDWLRKLRQLAAAFILGSLLHLIPGNWPGNGAQYVVPAVLLLLAAYGVQRGSAIGAASVLRYGVYFVLFLLVFAGAKNVKPESFLPRAELPDLSLAVVLLLPLLSAGEKGKSIPLNGIAAVLAAVLTVGETSLYEYSRGLSLGSISTHLESLAASAITVGWFAAICYILDSTKENAKEEVPGKSGWITALLAYGIYLTGYLVRPEALVIMELLLWAVVPLLWNFQNFIKSRKKFLTK